MKKKKREQWVYYRWVNGNGAIWDQDNTELGTQRIEHMEPKLALTAFSNNNFYPPVINKIRAANFSERM